MSEKGNITKFRCVETCPPSIITKEETAATKQYNQDIPFIPFGSDNLFPQCLAAIKRKAAIHNSIISWKTTYMIGSSVQETGNINLDDWIKDVDGKGHGLQYIAERHFEDDNTFGNLYQIFITDKRRTFINFTHMQSAKARWARDENAILFHPDWLRYNTSDKDLITKIPVYPEFGEIEGSPFLYSCVPLADYEPEFQKYGLPTYVAGLNTIAISYKTDIWNESRLDNSFQPSGILEASVGSDDEAKDLVANAKKTYSGEGNNSKLLVVAKEPGAESATSFTPFLQNSEGEFVNIHEISTNDQVTAHKWFKSLAGIAQNTGFEEGGKLMLTEFSVAVTKVITPKQKKYLEPIKMVLKDFGFDPTAVDELKFLNEPPVSAVVQEIDINKVLTKGEARELLGLSNDNMTEQEKNEPIDNGKSSKNGDNNKQ